MSLEGRAIMDLRYKLNRIMRWARVCGFIEALKFEVNWSLKRDRVKVRPKGFPQPLVIRRDTSDLSVFETVFIKAELDIGLPKNPKLIIDGGANVGFSTAYYAKKYPHARVIAVEPSTANCEMLRTNCRPWPNVTLVEGALWSSSGLLRIVNPDDAAWSFRCVPAVDGSEGTLRAHRLVELIENSGFERCDMLKLDVEGAELDLFGESSDGWISAVDTILVEVHGVECQSAIERACPEPQYVRTQIGEKLLIRAVSSQ